MDVARDASTFQLKGSNPPKLQFSSLAKAHIRIKSARRSGVLLVGLRRSLARFRIRRIERERKESLLAYPPDSRSLTRFSQHCFFKLEIEDEFEVEFPGESRGKPYANSRPEVANRR